MHRTWFSPRLDSVLATDDATFLALFDPVAAGFDSSAEVPSRLTALLDYFQARALSDLPPIPEHMTEVAFMPQAELIDRARRIVAHRFELAEEPEVSFGERIDWNFDPTADPRRRWCRELHRHRWVAILAEAYQQTADESFAAAFSRLIADWIRSNPPPPSGFLIYRNAG